MKKSFARLFFFLAGFLVLFQNASAQSISPDVAFNLKNRAMEIHAKIQSTKSFALVDKSSMNSNEARVLDEILPKIESLLIEAADLFTKAAETLPDWEGQECLRKGCGKLKDAQHKVREARDLLRKEGVLHAYADLLDDIKKDIKDAVEDAGCRRVEQNSNPWNGKYFRSEYNNPKGQWISGHSQLNGDKGFYETNSGERGTFDRVFYRDNNRIAEGYWRFQSGSTGWFSFTLNGDNKSFYGSWGNGDRIGQNQQGTWKGNL